MNAATNAEAELVSAIKSQDLKLMKKILEAENICTNFQDDSGHTPLGLAASNNFMLGAEALLNMGALIDQADFYGQIPIQYAANNGHLDMLRLLIKHGGFDVNWTGDNSSGLSALHLATLNYHKDIVQELILAKCNINVMDGNGISVLHCAVGNSHRDIVELLLNARVHVNIRGVNSGRTPLFVAAEVGNMEILNMLIKAGARVNIPNDYEMMPLCAVCLQDNTLMALRLLQPGVGSKVNSPDNNGSIPLHYAARFGNIQVMKALIANGSELNTLNEHFESPLHKAVANCHVNAVELLVKNGCDVNISDPRGMVTALHGAVNAYNNLHDFSQLLEILISGNCVLDTCAFLSMETPLYRALNIEKVEFAKVLLQHGSNPNADCPFDITILQKACEKRLIELIELLLHCDIDWSRESWLDSDIHSSGINPKLLTGYAEHVPMVLIKDVNLYRKLLQVRCNPHRLVDICRWTIRHHLSTKLYIKLRKTQLPQRLQNFVMLKIL